MNGIAIRKIQRASRVHIDGLADCGVATVHEAQGRIGLLKPYMRPIYPMSRLGGSAVTVLVHPGDNWMLHVAIELCEPGDILAVACSSESDDGFFGELLAVSCKARGISGLIIDGGIRDSRELTEMEFPVWSKAIHAKGTVKATVGAVNLPIVCAGQFIHPGDVLVADNDGVVVVRREQAATILDASQKRLANECEKLKRLAGGELGLDIYNMRPRLSEAGLRYFDSLEEYRQAEDAS